MPTLLAPAATSSQKSQTYTCNFVVGTRNYNIIIAVYLHCFCCCRVGFEIHARPSSHNIIYVYEPQYIPHDSDADKCKTESEFKNHPPRTIIHEDRGKKNHYMQIFRSA